uniref:Uncharacterized protein n=1 Tax=Moniliophthora roreri TaxID=221103 RepID=A0A0W0G1Q6_MONRR
MNLTNSLKHSTADFEEDQR